MRTIGVGLLALFASVALVAYTSFVTFEEHFETTAAAAAAAAADDANSGPATPRTPSGVVGAFGGSGASPTAHAASSRKLALLSRRDELCAADILKVSFAARTAWVRDLLEQQGSRVATTRRAVTLPLFDAAVMRHQRRSALTNCMCRTLSARCLPFAPSCTHRHRC